MRPGAPFGFGAEYGVGGGGVVWGYFRLGNFVIMCEICHTISGVSTKVPMLVVGAIVYVVILVIFFLR